MGLIKRLGILLLIVILLALLSIYWPSLTGKVSQLSNNNENSNFVKETVFVTRVVDGDTIHARVNGADETIRLLGINTPEKNKPYYNEAKNFLIHEIENKSVEILKDKEDVDKYGRKLRYIFYGDRMINVEIVENGFATTFMLDDLDYKDKFETAEKFARQNGIGLWMKSSDKCAFCISLVKLEFNAPEYFIIKNNCDFECNLDGWLVKDDANHFFNLDNLLAGEIKEYKTKTGTEVWNDLGDRFFMRDNYGRLVVFYQY
ncbi:Staphylococcal nuclease homologue [uncultured archaeon]|nr:Staphylococcal nuclease homologue [uncultured archaeon]